MCINEYQHGCKHLHLISGRALVLLLCTFVLVLTSPADARFFRMFKSASEPPSFVDVPPEEGSVSDTSSASSSQSSSVALIGDVQNEVVYSGQLRQGEGNLRLLGTFSIANASLGTFVLQLAFANGGALRHSEKKGVAAVVRMRDMELRYLDAYNRMVVKKLSENDYRGKGYIYEVNFLQEDVQELYEMELWGVPDMSEAVAAGNRGGGLYRGEIGLYIEPLLSPPEQLDGEMSLPSESDGSAKRRSSGKRRR